MKKVDSKDLLYLDEYGNPVEGYKVIYYYSENEYSVGSFCKTIEGLMMDFVTIDPIESEDDIPKFISIDDLLERELNLIDGVIGVALYKTNGECISSLFKKEKSK